MGQQIAISWTCFARRHADPVSHAARKGGAPAVTPPWALVARITRITHGRTSHHPARPRPFDISASRHMRPAPHSGCGPIPKKRLCPLKALDLIRSPIESSFHSLALQLAHDHLALNALIPDLTANHA